MVMIRICIIPEKKSSKIPDKMETEIFPAYVT